MWIQIYRIYQRNRHMTSFLVTALWIWYSLLWNLTCIWTLSRSLPNHYKKRNFSRIIYKFEYKMPHANAPICTTVSGDPKITRFRRETNNWRNKLLQYTGYHKFFGIHTICQGCRYEQTLQNSLACAERYLLKELLCPY